MMKCREYIFLLTSDQLAQARTPVVLGARLHRLLCRHCRAFTHNDQRLLETLAHQRETEVQALSPPGRS